MIRVTYFIVCLLLGITLVSCIRDEALNAEADILTCTVPGDILKRDPIIENNKSKNIVFVGNNKYERD